jgi:hypothetical protein
MVDGISTCDVLGIDYMGVVSDTWSDRKELIKRLLRARDAAITTKRKGDDSKPETAPEARL